MYQDLYVIQPTYLVGRDWRREDLRAICGGCEDGNMTTLIVRPSSLRTLGTLGRKGTHRS